MFADDWQIYLSFWSDEVAWAVEGVNTDLRSVECSKDADDLYEDKSKKCENLCKQ
jgi:hypothetical protein